MNESSDLKKLSHGEGLTKTESILIIIPIVCMFIFSLFAYFQYTTPKIIRKDVISDFSGVRIVNIPEIEEDFIIKYKNKEFYLSRFTFSNEEIASNFYKEFLSSLTNYVSRENANIKNYFGLSIELEKDSSIILRKDNVIIIVKGGNRENLIGVAEWFTENY